NVVARERPFHMPLVTSQRSCSANSHSNEMCCLQACQFYICSSSNVVLISDGFGLRTLRGRSHNGSTVP
uniref:Uncharacterized protein n=1 Tax=Strix occidentalis caurina TaxID=311401 RepID=A0A8D0FW57_STROC